jgi:lysophospholipase L1-like esterase
MQSQTVACITAARMLRRNKHAGNAMRSGFIRGLVVIAVLVSCRPGMAADNWVAAWGTAQQLMKPERVIPSAQVPPPKVERQTVRMVARSAIAGSQLRVSLSNSFGHGPVRIDAAQVARAADDGAIFPGSSRPLTFGGRAWVVLPPGARISSDPVPFDVRAQADLTVSLYVEGDSGPTTSHPIGLRGAWLAPGNQVTTEKLSGATLFRSYLWLEGIDVMATARTAAVIAFGDSITDGFSTTPDADTPWPSILARRLAAQRGAAPRSVINMGISGNRVLREGAGSSGLARFDRDVLSRPGARWVLLLLGINDIGFSAIPGLPASEKATAEDIIAGYQMLIARARLHGLTIIGATLTPFEGVNTYTPASEQMRQQVNQWIRGSKQFDAIVDFDLATRDPGHPTRLRPEFDSGDHIHPNDTGNRAMAEAVDLKLFR